MVSTGGAMGMTIEQRSTGLEARPDMSGIETGSLNFGRDLFPTLPHETEGIAARAAELGIPLEIEAFEIGHIDAALDFQRRGVLPVAAADQHRRRLPGRAGGDLAQPHGRGRRAAGGCDLVRDCDRAASDAHAHARAPAGRDLRARRLRGQRLPAQGPARASNAELVEQIGAIARSVGREPATVEQARRLLSLPQASGVAR